MPYIFSVSRPDGTRVIAHETGEFLASGNRIDSEISRLYEVARARALGIDETLDQISRDLGLDDFAT